MDDIREAIKEANRKVHVATCVALSKRWLAEHPNDFGVVNMLAESLTMMARYEEALRVYHDAIDRFPEQHWGIYNQIGHLYRYRGEFDQAAAWYEKAIADDPTEASSYIFVGAIKARQGKLREAEEMHRKATLCLEGAIDEAFHNLGLVLRGQGRLAEAADCFRRAIEIDPEYTVAVDALNDVVRALEEVGGG